MNRSAAREHPGRRIGRRHLRVAIEMQALVAWGYQQQRCTVTEFSTHGLSLRGVDAAVGTPLSLALPLADGAFTLCGVVVHRRGADGTLGVRLAPLPPAQLFELECYLWELLAQPLRDASQCSVAGCSRPKKARGLCARHYNQSRRRDRSLALV